MRPSKPSNGDRQALPPASRSWTGLTLIVLTAALAGCVSRNHQMETRPTPPVPLDLTVSTEHPRADGLDFTPPVTVTLHTVIIHDGPGSWKRAAGWDEYVISIANGHQASLMLESAGLEDFEGRMVWAGDDPWAVERESRRWVQEVGAREAGAVVVIGATSVLTAGASVASAVGAMMGGGAGAGVGVALLPLAAPAYVMTSVARDLRGQEKIEGEFRKRLLLLPAEIRPGTHVQGSLFFRYSPGPRRLTLRCSHDGTLTVLEVPLAPLEDLHLRPGARRPDVHRPRP
jgi:hypothetical protein